MKKPIPWAVALVAIMYWGALIWWQYDSLFGSSTEQMNSNATWALVFSVVYVAMLLLFFMRDTPENISSIPVIGKSIKFYCWLIFSFGLTAWCIWIDTEAVAVMFVGVLLMGLIAAMALCCLMYRGEKSSRLYALKRFVDVYPSIAKPEGHVRFNQKLWTTVLVLIIYFGMTNVLIWGMSGTALDLSLIHI